MLPGASILKLQFFDYDSYKGDDFLGETQIDIETRYYDEKWNANEFFPIETRELFLPESGAAAGSVRLWVEIVNQQDPQQKHEALLDSTKSSVASTSQLSLLDRTQDRERRLDKVEIERPVWSLAMMPEGGLEIRVVVWEAFDCPIDDPEGMSDIFVTCELPNLRDAPQLRTEVHARSEGYVRASHQGCFNWRMKFEVKGTNHFDPRQFQLLFKLWDFDLLTPNDFLASCSYDAVRAVNACIANGTKASAVEAGEQKFELSAVVAQSVGKKSAPSLLVSVEVLTAAE